MTSWLALSRNKKIIRKPFGRLSQEIVMLWRINKEVTSPSWKSAFFLTSDIRQNIFAQIYRAQY